MTCLNRLVIIDVDVGRRASGNYVMVCYYDTQLDPSTHLHRSQVSVREVLKWFSDLSAPTRVEFVCGLLQLLTPPELRFYGSCLEEIARQDYESLYDAELQANAPMDNYGVLTLYNTIPSNLDVINFSMSSSIPIPPSFIILSNSPTLRSKLILSLSLLKSTNVPAATSYFETLMADEHEKYSPKDLQTSTATLFKPSHPQKSKLSKDPSISSDDSDDELSSANDILKCISPQVLDEIMLIYTLAAFHPAFSFDQKQRLYKRLSTIKELSDHSAKVTQPTSQQKDSSKKQRTPNMCTKLSPKSQSPSTSHNNHSCNNFPTKSYIPQLSTTQHRFYVNRNSLDQDYKGNHSPCGFLLRHCSRCHYHGSVTCRLRRHSLPSSFLRDNTDPRVESNIMLIPTVNQNSTDVHSNKNDMLDVLSVDSTQTDSSVVRLDDSIESSSQRKPTPHTDANQFIVNTQNSNDLCPKTARCLSPQSDNNGGSHNNTDFTLHDSDLNCLKEVHLWLTNPDRSIIANNVITRLNTLSTKSSVNLSNCQSTYKQQLSHAINPYFNSDVKQQQKSETSSCMSQTPTDNDAGEDGYRSKLSDNYQSDSQSCINITKTLTASEGLSVYKDFIQSSVDSISCLPSISPSSLTDPIYSQSSCSSSCAYNSRVTTTTCSNFRFGSEKCTKSITDYCHLVPKRHSSGSSPISTPPSEESGSDSAALKPPSPDYWTPKNSSHYTHRMIYTPYQSYSHTFPPVIGNYQDSLTKSIPSPCSNHLSRISNSTVTSHSSSVSQQKSCNQFTLEDFPSLSSLRSVINAESSNISTKHNKVNVNHCGNGDQNHRNTTNTVSTSNDNGGSNNNTLTSQSSYTVISNAASSCPGESSILPQNCQSTSEELRVDVGLHLKDDEDADNRRSHLDSIGSVHFETTINSNPSNCNRMMITNSTVDSHSSSLSRTSSTTITTTNTTTSANNNSNNFSISPHYWISPQGPIPIPPSALYPPYMLPSPVVIENSQSIQRLPMIYQWTVHPCIPTNGISNSNNPGTSFVPYLPSYVNIVTNDITKSEKVNLPEIVTAIGSHSPPQESNDDEVDEMKTKLSVPTIHSSTNITDNSITVNKNDNNSNNHYNVSATDLPLGSFIDTVRCTSTCLELHHNTITPSSTIGIFTQPCILLPSLSADTAVDGGITVANLPQPVSKTCVNLLKPSLCRTSDETQIALCSLTPPSLSSSVQTIATITTTTGSIITNNNSNNDFYTLQLNAAMKRLNDELDLAVVNDTKIQISNGTIVHSLPITPITSVTTTIVAAGAATTIPRESQIHSSGRFISHAVNRASRSNVSSTEEPLTDPVVTSVESNEFLDSVNCTRSSGQGLSANETFFNSTWFYPRFITRPDSSNPSVCNTSITQLNYPTRGYSPMTTFNNPILSRGYVQPQIANTFYCAQHSGLTLIPTPVTSHSSFISSIPNPSMHFQHPPPIFGFIPNPPTSNISVDSYRGIPTVSSNSVKSNICSITQSSTASLDPMSTTALLTNNLFHVQSLPLLHNLVLHPPLHPAFPPPLPNVANNSNNMPSMTISSLSTMNGPRILSCYNCGQPGHKANTCPSRWSSQQLSENGFSLNYAPRK